jgi:hypothetical protein
MVSNIANLTLARLREGKAGATGATVLTIYGAPLGAMSLLELSPRVPSRRPSLWAP